MDCEQEKEKGKEINETVQVEEKILSSSVCTFCRAPIEAGQDYCPECGSPTRKTICPNCGHESYFDFCEHCNMPLSSAAKDLIKKIRQSAENTNIVDDLTRARRKEDVVKTNELNKKKIEQKENKKEKKIIHETLTGNWYITDLFRTEKEYHGKTTLLTNQTFTLMEWNNGKLWNPHGGHGIWTYDPYTSFFQYRCLPGGGFIGKISGTIDEFLIDGYWYNGKRAHTRWKRDIIQGNEKMQ